MGLKRSVSGVGSKPTPKLAPCVSRALPSSPMICVFCSSKTEPAAAATSGSAVTSSTSDSSIGGAADWSPWKLMSAPFPETTTSVSA